MVHPELPAPERSTQTASKGQEKSTKGKRKKKKEQEHPKEERQEKGSRKSAGKLVQDLEQTFLVQVFFCVKGAEGGEHQCCYYVLTHLERLGEQEQRWWLPSWLGGGHGRPDAAVM